MGKLRWKRAEGHIFKLNKAISPEMVRDKVGTIVDFGKTTNPTDITASMKPILDNLGTAKEKSHGGNEFIDVDAALGYEFEPLESAWTERDVSLYALGVGAAKNPLDENDLKLVYEMSSSGFYPL